jgi:hypothetical protein
VTPAWRPDGQAIVAAAAREGEPFNLYEIDLSVDPAPARPLTAATGGALWPDVSLDGSTIVFVGYTPDGFDLFTMPYERARREPAIVWSAGAQATARPARAAADVAVGASRRYNPLPTLLPTSWMPTLDLDDDQVRLGAAVAGHDVLGYHAYYASAAWLVTQPAGAAGLRRSTPDWEVSYAYNRWKPTLFVSASRDTFFSPDATVRSRQVEAGAAIPWRRVRVAQQALASITRTVDDYAFPEGALSLGRSAVRAGWALSSARLYGFSISPEHGITAGATVEVVPAALGSSAPAAAITADVRAYLPGAGAHHTVALRAGGGVANGEPGIARTFVLGGADPAASVLDFDGDAFSLLRGFEPNLFSGSRIAVVNADYRWPLGRPERGIRTWPIFLHSVHASAFVDAGHAWTARFRFGDVKTAAGAELAADLVVGYNLPITIAAGAAWGRDGAARASGGTAFVRVGHAF